MHFGLVKYVRKYRVRLSVSRVYYNRLRRILPKDT